MDPERASALPFVPTSRPPLAIAAAEGVHLVTPDGRRILDAAGGAIVANVGHGRREVAEAFADAASELTYAVPPFASEHRVRLVERLRERWLPAGLDRVAFTSGGSESVDTALRVARQHQLAMGRPEKSQVIGRELSYHGVTLATLGVGGNTKRRRGFEPMFPDWPKAPAPYCLRCGRGPDHTDCGAAYADALLAILEREGPETVAAFVAEPIGGSTAGALVPPDDYWPRILEICRAHDVLVIADEVMTGFGRTGRRFAVEHWDVVPDILVGGKGLTGGYAPMGGVYASNAVMQPIADAGAELMFFTYSGHPGSCAAAECVLRILEEEALVERAAAVGARLRERLAVLEEHPHVAEVRGRGLLLAVELVRDRETLEPFPAEAGLTAKVVAAGLAEGVFFYPGGCPPAQDVVCLGPPFVIGDEHVEQMGKTLERAIDAAVARATEQLAG